MQCSRDWFSIDQTIRKKEENSVIVPIFSPNLFPSMRLMLATLGITTIQFARTISH